MITLFVIVKMATTESALCVLVVVTFHGAVGAGFYTLEECGEIYSRFH